MQQMARNTTMEGCGALRHLVIFCNDRDTKILRWLPDDYTTAADAAKFRVTAPSNQGG